MLMSMATTATRLSPEASRLLHEKRATRLPPPAERRALRDAAGFSLEEMGRALGIAKATAHRWESFAVRLPRERAGAYLALMDAWRELIRESATVQPQK